MKSRGPWILLVVLALIIVFVAGTRYGTNVERVNKTIRYIVSLTPPPPSPTPSPTLIPMKYKTYVSKQCAMSFVYPGEFKKNKESSQSAQFVYDDQPQLAFSCEVKKPKFADFEKYTLAASESAKVNTVTGKKVYFKMNPALVPLVESSIKFSR